MLTLFIIIIVLDLRNLHKQVKANEAELKDLYKEIHGRDC